jgi:hypothetical protein
MKRSLQLMPSGDFAATFLKGNNMKIISHETGRIYDTKQVLEIVVESDIEDEFGIRDIVATFNDSSRNIKGKVNTVVFNDGIGQAVLDAYDAGRYQSL